MKNLSKTFYCNVAILIIALLLVGCTGNKENTSKTNTSDSNSTSLETKSTTGTGTSESNASDKNSATASDESKSNDNSTSAETKSTTGTGTSESNASDKDSATASDESESKVANGNENSTSGSDKNNTLSKYSSKEIEYSRIWLQLGANQNIDELDVVKIKAGEPLNPNDKTSAKYPEDVTQISGSRLVDGSVTYSSNGNGTINVYNVPLRWDGSNPAGTEFYKNIIKNKKLVHVNPGNNEKLIPLIKKIDYTTR